LVLGLDGVETIVGISLGLVRSGPSPGELTGLAGMAETNDSQRIAEPEATPTNRADRTHCRSTACCLMDLSSMGPLRHDDRETYWLIIGQP
jgi:hypothetical protein